MLPAARPRWRKRESLPLGTASSPLGPTGFRSLLSSSTGKRPWHSKAPLSSSFFRSKANIETQAGLYKPPVHRQIRRPCPAPRPNSSLPSSRPRSSQLSLASRCAPSTNAPRERPNARSVGKAARPVPAAKVASAARLAKVRRAGCPFAAWRGARSSGLTQVRASLPQARLTIRSGPMASRLVSLTCPSSRSRARSRKRGIHSSQNRHAVS